MTDPASAGVAELVHDCGREVLAGFKALGQSALQPDPRFLGKKETGVTDALAAAGKPVGAPQGQ